MGIGIMMLTVIGSVTGVFMGILVIGVFLWLSYNMYKDEEYIMSIITIVMLIFIILVAIALTLVWLEV